MALQDMPLSDLDSASSVGNTDLMYLVQSGESKKVTAQTLIGNKADLSAGKLILSQFPNTSKEVLNDTARYALTTNDVRNGFIVIVSQPTEKMYLVTDETNLDNASGYTAFAADAMWSSIQGKPNNLVVYETSGNVSTLKSEGGTALNPKTTTEALVDENGVSCKDRIAYGEESASVTVEPMSPYLHESDIVNDLVTNDPTKPLSAAQGYTLNSNLSGNLIYTNTYPSTTTWTNLIQNLYNNLTASAKYQALTDNQRCCLKFVFGNDVFNVSNYQSTLFLLGSVQNNGSGTTVTRSMYVSSSTRNYSRFTVTSGGAVAASDYTTQAIGSEMVVQVLM